MATPTQAQASNHQQRQALIAAAGAAAVRRLLEQKAPWPDVAATFASYQLAAVLAAIRTMAGWASSTPLTDPTAFTGVSSAGFPAIEPLIATIDRFEPAPPEALPDAWWDDAKAFMQSAEQLIASEIADAGRTASQVEMVGQGWTNYIRMLKTPSCDRCTILAGRMYRDLEAFDRHPGCDCVMVPVDDAEAARARGLISDPEEAFEKGLVGGYRTDEDGAKTFVPSLSKADRRAIADGADPATVVNARRAGIRAPAGITNALTVDLFGRQVKATLLGTTKRAQWRKQNPTRLVRLRPESIYQFAVDREDALRLLRLYGYLPPAA